MITKRKLQRDIQSLENENKYLERRLFETRSKHYELERQFESLLSELGYRRERVREHTRIVREVESD